MSKSEFARKQLHKYGWKEGAGLGKDEGGRSEAIKPSLKMDRAGVGHDPGKEFTDHWWLRVFNDAAKKIGSKKEETVQSTEDHEIQKKKEKSDKKAQFYKGFVKSSLLANGVEEKHEEAEVIEDNKDESEQSSIPTLDDIHKFCGGATGHRAAMFGIKMKGKLSRVARQDLQFEEQQKQKEKQSQNGDISIHTDHSMLLSDQTLADGEENSKNKHKKKKKKLKKEEVHQEKNDNFNRFDSSQESSGDPVKQIKTKKKKKDKRSIEKSMQECSEPEEPLNHSKCSQEHLMEDEHGLESVDVRSCDSPKQKKRKKRKAETNSDQIPEQNKCSAEGEGLEENYLEVSETLEGGHSKKKKKRDRPEDSKQTCEYSEEYKEKRRKKKRKKDKTA